MRFNFKVAPEKSCKQLPAAEQIPGKGAGGDEEGDLCSEQPHWLSQTQLKLRGLTTLHNEKVRWFSVKETIRLELEHPDATTRRGVVEGREARVDKYVQLQCIVTVSRKQTK